jgi:hypothetical protein
VNAVLEAGYTVGDYLLDRLAELGVTEIFGVSSSEDDQKPHIASDESIVSGPCHYSWRLSQRSILGAFSASCAPGTHQERTNYAAVLAS